jgi:hypothetical protein
MTVWIVLACIAFAIAALIAFSTLSGISVIGLVCVGLFFTALHLSGLGSGWGRHPNG